MLLFSNKVYDILKEVTTVILPALGTLYFALSTIWGLPYGEQIVGTITAIVACLGACLHISTKNYNRMQGEPMDYIEDIDEVDEE